MPNNSLANLPLDRPKLSFSCCVTSIASLPLPAAVSARSPRAADSRYVGYLGEGGSGESANHVEESWLAGSERTNERFCSNRAPISGAEAVKATDGMRARAPAACEIVGPYYYSAVVSAPDRIGAMRDYHKRVV